MTSCTQLFRVFSWIFSESNRTNLTRKIDPSVFVDATDLCEVELFFLDKYFVCPHLKTFYQFCKRVVGNLETTHFMYSTETIPLVPSFMVCFLEAISEGNENAF